MEKSRLSLPVRRRKVTMSGSFYWESPGGSLQRGQKTGPFRIRWRKLRLFQPGSHGGSLTSRKADIRWRNKQNECARSECRGRQQTWGMTFEKQHEGSKIHEANSAEHQSSRPAGWCTKCWVIDADADVLSTHLDSQSKLQMSDEGCTQTCSFIFKQHCQWINYVWGRAMHPHHLYSVI